LHKLNYKITKIPASEVYGVINKDILETRPSWYWNTHFYFFDSIV